MGINVELRDERGTVLAQVGDPDMVLSRAVTSGALSNTRLLRYLQPWGDAIFNEAQRPDLSTDIRALVGENPGSPLGKLLTQVEPLLETMVQEPHVYLWFVGD